jgi:hypothetical protein
MKKTYTALAAAAILFTAIHTSFAAEVTATVSSDSQQTPVVTYVSVESQDQADAAAAMTPRFTADSTGINDTDNDGIIDQGPVNGTAEPTPASLQVEENQNQYASVMDALSAGDLATWFWLLLAILVLFVAVGYVYTRNSMPEEYSRFR